MTTAQLSAKDIQKALAEPFDPYDIEWRIGQARVYEDRGQQKVFAKCLAYVTNRAIMHRLDEVVGIGNWTNEYRPWHTAKSGPSQICRLSVRIDGEWIAKEDGAECSDIEAIKGGLSDAMKRAAYQFGIGRYLYDLPEGIAETRTDKPGRDDGHWNFAKAEVRKGGDTISYWWQPPTLPDWALPKDMREKKPDPPADPPQSAPFIAPQPNAMERATERVQLAKEHVPSNTEMHNSLKGKRAVKAKGALLIGEAKNCSDLDDCFARTTAALQAGNLNDADAIELERLILERYADLAEEEAELSRFEDMVHEAGKRNVIRYETAEAYGNRIADKRARQEAF